MTPAKTHKPEFPGKLYGLPTIIYSLTLLLGSLSMVFSEAPVFAGITVFILGAIIFTQARRLVPVLGIITPCLFLIATGNLTVPSIYIGFIYSFGVSAYLMIGKGSFRTIAPVISAYAAAAIVLGPLEALPVFIPAALGILASPMLRRRPLSETLSMLTILLFGAALTVFLVVGGDLTEIGDYIRNYIVELYGAVNEEMFVIEERVVEMLATYFVNILPGLVFAAASAICYIACDLTVSLFASSTSAEIPESMYVLSLTPVSGVVYIICFLLSTAFALEGRAYEMAGAVTDNILVALTLPFIRMGCARVIGFFRREKTGFQEKPPMISFIAIIVLFMISPSVAAAVFTFLGIAASVKPITSAIFRKFTRTDKKDSE
ncbi:MAG: hypothetical protein J6S71_03170 [Clostridia bacterium]|nr:hypothetical protein [Clostridia bacterium]